MPSKLLNNDHFPSPTHILHSASNSYLCIPRVYKAWKPYNWFTRRSCATPPQTTNVKQHYAEMSRLGLYVKSAPSIHSSTQETADHSPLLRGLQSAWARSPLKLPPLNVLGLLWCSIQYLGKGGGDLSCICFKAWHCVTLIVFVQDPEWANRHGPRDSLNIH